MSKIFSILLFGLICINLTTQAQKVSVVSVSQNRDTNSFYIIMRDAFPLKHNDPAAPRFIFFDEDQHFLFGVGGYVQLTGAYDFNGLNNHNSFITSKIAPKGHQKGCSYGMAVNQSRLFFKLLGDTEIGRIVTYLEMDFQGAHNTARLCQAFIQFRGFTLGQTWSTFCDMATVPTTIDGEGPGSALEVRQPMLRYTHKWGNHWQTALALEYAATSYTTNKYIEEIQQKVLDIPLTIQYIFLNKSHIQLGGILRNISYHDLLHKKDRIRNGWGVMASSKINLNTKNCFMLQGEYGKGIAHYIQDIAGQGFDLIPNPNQNGKLKAPSMWGFFFAYQHFWDKVLHSTVTYSYTRLGEQADLSGDTYKYTQYTAANLLWDFTEFGTTGIEYVFGHRNNFNHTYGNANRINLMVQYRF